MRLNGPQRAWSLRAEAVLDALAVNRSRGLDSSEIAPRRARFGDNTLQPAPPRSAWSVFVSQWQSFIMILLLGAAAVSLAFGDVTEAVAVLVVIAVNVVIGFATELRATRSMEGLRALTEVNAKVLRDGAIQLVPANELVVGDIVQVEAGDTVPADLRLVISSNLEVDESTLTGESVPVSKRPEPVSEDSELAERHSMAFRGTAATRGVCTGIVVATGRSTELGRVASLVETVEREDTPLERELDRFGKRLAWVSVLLASLVALTGLLGETTWVEMVETGIALAIATVPEGLPVVATIALARGMYRMAKRNALLTKLAAVETLGAVSVIVSDKTGTLTENRMTVEELALEAGSFSLEQRQLFRDDEAMSADDVPALKRALEIGVACNDASIDPDGNGPVGDPMEVALLRAGLAGSITQAGLDDANPELREEAFDPERKMMASLRREEDGVWCAVKGAPEAVLEVSTQQLTATGPQPLTPSIREHWQELEHALAASGLRVLALAEAHHPTLPATPYRDLTWVGLVGLVDPPRRDIAPALAACRAAGIRVVVLTGDQAATAAHVGRAVGLLDDDGTVMVGRDLELDDAAGRQEALRASLICRVSPEQKLRMIEAYRDAGFVVAMLGDGVNDAPALRRADIGVAMGLRGTTVAQEAASMVLRDDRFSTIVAAIAQGRAIFENIRKFVVYLLSCNVSELVAVGVSSLLPIPVALTALQILFLNLVTDVFPALALGVSEAAPGLMQRPPRATGEPIVDRSRWLRIFGYGSVLTAAVLIALYVAYVEWQLDARRAGTLSFLTLAIGQLVHVFNMADDDSPILINEVSRNPWVWGALLLCTALLGVALYVPAIAGALRLVPPDARGWGLVFALSGTVFGLVALWRALRSLRSRKRPSSKHGHDSRHVEI